MFTCKHRHKHYAANEGICTLPAGWSICEHGDPTQCPQAEPIEPSPAWGDEPGARFLGSLFIGDKWVDFWLAVNPTLGRRLVMRRWGPGDKFAFPGYVRGDRGRESPEVRFEMIGEALWWSEMARMEKEAEPPCPS